MSAGWVKTLAVKPGAFVVIAGSAKDYTSSNGLDLSSAQFGNICHGPEQGCR